MISSRKTHVLTMRAVPSLPGCTGLQSLTMSRVYRLASSRPHWLRTCSGSGTLQSPADTLFAASCSECLLGDYMASCLPSVYPCGVTAVGYRAAVIIYQCADAVAMHRVSAQQVRLQALVAVAAALAELSPEEHKDSTLPLRPLGSVHPFLFIEADTPMRFCFTIEFLMDSRPCFLISVFLLLAKTTLLVAGARLLHMANHKTSALSPSAGNRSP